MNKNVFIVNSIDGTKIISASVLVKDLAGRLHAAEWRKCDVDSLAKDLLKAFTGQAFNSRDYEDILNRAIQALDMYTALTPFKFMDTYLPAWLDKAGQGGV